MKRKAGANLGVGRMGEEESRFRAEAEPDWGLWAPEKGKQGKAGERGAGGVRAEK